MQILLRSCHPSPSLLNDSANLCLNKGYQDDKGKRDEHSTTTGLIRNVEIYVHFIDKKKEHLVDSSYFFCTCPPPELLPMLGPLEWYMMPTLDVALLCSSRVASDLGHTLDRLRSFVDSSLHSIFLREPYMSLSCA